MTSGAYEFEITAADGVTVFGVSLVDEVDRHGDLRGLRRAYDAQLSPADADEPLADWLEPVIQETFIGGCGVHYAQAPGVCTRFGSQSGDEDLGHAFPGPAENAVALPAPNNTNTPLVAIEEYGGDIYIAQVGTNVANSPRVVKTNGGGVTLADSLNVGANNSLSDLITFRYNRVNYMFASGNDAVGGRLHRNAAGVWTSTDPGGTGAGADFGTNRRDWLAKAFWTTDGVGAWRMVAGNGGDSISYTRPFSNPMLAASWVEAVQIETNGSIHKAATARRHVYLPSRDGLFDLDEQGNSPNLTTYTSRMQHPFNGVASYYQDGYVYVSFQQTIDRIWVGDSNVVQEDVGVCGPGAFTEAEHEWGGYCTYITGDQGWIVAAFVNPNTQKSSIWWGRDRKHYPNVTTPNPMIWHGPEIISTSNYYVTAMRTNADIASNSLRLWVTATPYDPSSVTLTSGAPIVQYFTLPTVGQPLSDILTSGKHKFANGNSPSGNWQPYSRIYSLPKTWRDKGSQKIIYETVVGDRGVGGTSDATMNLYLRADPAPGSGAWGTPVAIASGPTQAVPPVETTKGHKIEWRVDFFAPSGAATPVKVGLLDAVRITAWRIVPSLSAVTLNVQYGDGVRGSGNSEDSSHHPDQITAWLKELTESDRTVVRFPDDQRRSVKFRQVLDLHEELTPHGQYGKKVVSKLILADLGVAS